MQYILIRIGVQRVDLKTDGGCQFLTANRGKRQQANNDRLSRQQYVRSKMPKARRTQELLVFRAPLGSRSRGEAPNATLVQDLDTSEAYANSDNNEIVALNRNADAGPDGQPAAQLR